MSIIFVFIFIILKNNIFENSIDKVDNIDTATICGVETVKSNSVTNSFIESKRLELGF